MFRNLRHLRTLVVLALWLQIPLFAGVSQAEYISPDKVNVKTERYQPSHTAFDEGVYRYDVSWQGIPVASAAVTVVRDEVGDVPYLHVTADAKTAKTIDWIYRLRHRTESLFEATTFEPNLFYTWQTENSRQKLREVTFDEDGKISAKRWKNGKSRDDIIFHSSNATFDPISAAFIARSLPVDVGAEKSFDVFNGKHRFLITFNVVAREKIRVGGEKRDAFKVVPKVKKLTDSKGERRLKSATLWISADEKREVLKLESKVWVGSVRAELEEFHPPEQTVKPIVAPAAIRDARAQLTDTP